MNENFCLGVKLLGNLNHSEKKFFSSKEKIVLNKKNINQSPVRSRRGERGGVVLYLELSDSKNIILRN